MRYCVPGYADGLTAAAGRGGAVNAAAEADKRRRYPDGRTPWRVVPLATETGGRHGPAALKHLRALARQQAALQHLGWHNDKESARSGTCKQIAVGFKRRV